MNDQRPSNQSLRSGIEHALDLLLAEVDHYDDDSGNPPHELEFIRRLMGHLNGTLMGATDEQAAPASKTKRYKAEWVRTPNAETKGHWRITDVTSDTRVATCYLRANAQLVVDALNGAADEPPGGLSADLIATAEEIERLPIDAPAPSDLLPRVSANLRHAARHIRPTEPPAATRCLLEQAQQYMRHDGDCSVHRNSPCDCGLSALDKMISSAVSTPEVTGDQLVNDFDRGYAEGYSDAARRPETKGVAAGESVHE